MALYSKFCIMCQVEFKTLKINTLFCSKKCANRSRSLPLKLKESLIQRNTGFSMVVDNRPTNIKSDDVALAIAAAKEIARKRVLAGEMKLSPDASELAIANEKFINETDPALGGSDGFGISGEDSANSASNNDAGSGENPTVQKQKGLRRLGKKS